MKNEETWRSIKDAEDCEVISRGNACQGEGWFSNNREFEVGNELRQERTLAPTMFNIYLSVVVANWRDRYEKVGVGRMYCISMVENWWATGLLNLKLKKVKVTETQFADDAALYATSKVAFESAAAAGYEKVASDFRVQLSVEKTKGMAVGQEVDVTQVQVKGGSLDIVDHFSHLN